MSIGNIKKRIKSGDATLEELLWYGAYLKREVANRVFIEVLKKFVDPRFPK